MDLDKLPKKSPQFRDETGPGYAAQSMLLEPWSPDFLNWKEKDPNVWHTWTPQERRRFKKGERAHDILRDRMRNAFIYNFFFGGRNESYDPAVTFKPRTKVTKEKYPSDYDKY